MGFTELLTFVFIALKLTEVIAWSWWLVLLPEIIAAVVYILIVVVLCSGTVKTERAYNRILGNRRRW